MASSRGNPDMGDVLRSVAVLVVAVLALFGIGQFLSSTPDQPARSVDWKPAAQSASRGADYPIMAPASLPAGWRATSARYTRETSRWVLGVLTDKDDYLGIEQTTESVRSVLDRVAEGSEPAGSAKVRDRVWAVNAGPNDKITYSSRVDGISTVITGTVDQSDLEAYIASLKEK